MTLVRKIALLGDSAVGKTSLVRKYVFNQPQISYDATVGCRLSVKKLKIRNHKKTENLKLMIWDLLGTKGYRALHARTFVGLHGAICISDISRKETLDSIGDYWIPSLFEINEDIPMVFVCNKSDLKGRYEFEYEDLVDLSEKYNSDYDNCIPSYLKYHYFTSIKKGSEIGEAFETIGNLALGYIEEEDPVRDIYESLVATTISKTTDNSTQIGALDAIMVDFCNGFVDTRLAMLLLQSEIARAGIDINNPTKWRILKAIEYMAEAENEFLDEEIVHKNFDRRMKWASQIKEPGYIQDSKGDFEILRPSL